MKRYSVFTPKPKKDTSRTKRFRGRIKGHPGCLGHGDSRQRISRRVANRQARVLEMRANQKMQRRARLDRARMLAKKIMTVDAFSLHLGEIYRGMAMSLVAIDFRAAREAEQAEQRRQAEARRQEERRQRAEAARRLREERAQRLRYPPTQCPRCLAQFEGSDHDRFCGVCMCQLYEFRM